MVKLGVIGFMAESNGHPYSWSAIVNGGFNPDGMSGCGVRVKSLYWNTINSYLTANRDTLGIEGAKVTHVWTQDREISDRISRTSLVENVVDNPEDMVGKVDAVLLERDDPDSHIPLAKPFLEAGIPIFIDKPLAVNRKDLEFFSAQHQAGKFFMSCSTMRYSPEARIVKQNISQLGDPRLATAVGTNDWLKYGVLLLEGLFSLLDDLKTVTHIG